MIICRKKDSKGSDETEISEGNPGAGCNSFLQLKMATESATIYMKMQIVALFINNRG